MKFFTNKSIWTKIIIVLIFVILFEFVVTKPSLGAEVTDSVVEGGGKLLTPVVSLVVTIGDAFMYIIQNAIMGTNESILQVDVDASIWEVIGHVFVVAVAVVATIATIVGAIASGVGIVALIGTIASAIFNGVAGTAIGWIVVDIATSSATSSISDVSASVFPENVKLPATLYLPVFNYSPEEIFQGKVLLFNVNFFGDPIDIQQDEDGNYYYMDNGEKVITSRQNIAEDLSGTIASWYVGIRNIALVAMMIVLLYIGIRMLLSTVASDKAKYRQLLQDWLVGLMLLFLMHYIMAFSVTLVEKLTDIVSSSVDENVYAVRFPVDDKGKIVDFFNDKDITYMLYGEDGTQLTTDGTVDVSDGDVAYVVYPTNLMGSLRLNAQIDTGGFGYVGYSICYLVLVCFTFYFTFVYLKRVLYMAFLTLIAPVVAVTYPIDKINDGSAQGFTRWFREYIFNLLLQPMHLLLYFVLVTSAFDLAGQNVIYSIVAIGFLIPAEKLLRKFFGFEKSDTANAANGAAVGALAMAGVNRLSKISEGKKGSSSSREKSSGSGDSSDDDSKGVREAKNLFEGDVNETKAINSPAQEEAQKINDETERIDADQKALDEMKSDVTSDEDRKYIEEEQERINNEKAINTEAKVKNKDLAQQEKEEDKKKTLESSNIVIQNREKIRQKNNPLPKKAIRGVVKGVAKTAYKATPVLKTISKAAIPVAKVAGAAAAGTVGVAAGVAQGSPSDVARDFGVGIAAGSVAGKNITKTINNAASNLNDNRENIYTRLAKNEDYKEFAEGELLKEKQKEYKKVLKKNNFDKETINRMAEDGTINRYIKNDISAEDAVVSERIRENTGMTQGRAIAYTKYTNRVGDAYKGADATKWKKQFAEEFQEKGGMDKERAEKAAKDTWKTIGEFRKQKKKLVK